jgi:perosamine synthetase
LAEKTDARKFYPIAEPDIGELEIEYVTDAVRSGWVSSLGRYVEEFERGFAEFCRTRHAVSTANGTVALHLTLAALGIGPGDEVIVPTLTFIATASAVIYAGAVPVFVDSEPHTWCLNPAAVERAITPRTRAIIPVHLYGHPADMDPILDSASRHNLIVIEDAAESHGATYKGRMTGGLGNAGIFSFYGNKLITSGEGGMLVTNDSALADRANFLHDHAMRPETRYYHSEIGYNYRITNLQAALGLAQLRRAPELIARKRQIMGWYREFLGDREDLKLNPSMPWAESSFWMVCALLPSRLDPASMMTELRASGIDSRPFFKPLHRLPPLRKYDSGAVFPVAEDLSRRGISLPCGVKLNRQDVEFICSRIKIALDNSSQGSR